MRQETVTEYLKYTFSEQELREFSRSLARESTDLSDFEAAKKAATAQFAERIARTKAEIQMLSRRINTGSEYRNVDCDALHNHPTQGFKTIMRRDTGEIVRKVEMTESELQEQLQFEPTPPAEATGTAKTAAHA